jgi:CRP-like cAMP-binding protein
MDSLVLVVARGRPDVYQSLSRQCVGLEGVRVVMDRRESDTDAGLAADRRFRAVASDLAAVGFALVPAAGPMIPRTGGAPATIAVLPSGRLVISKAVARNLDKVLARMGPGKFFGEMNLFGGLQRSATVQAEADTELLVLDRDTLTAVVERNPGAGLAFFTALVREFSLRLSATDDLVREVTRWGLEASGFDTGDDRPLDTNGETR